MHHHELECHTKGCFAVLKVKVTARVLMIMTVSTISSDLLILLLSDLV